MKLKPSLVTFRQKERLEEKLADARNETLLSVIESLAENCQKNRELLLQLTKNNTTACSEAEIGSSTSQPTAVDHDLDRNMDNLREIFEFDIDEAQLLKALKKRSNNN